MAVWAFAAAAPALAQDEFSIFQLYYELNASAGDVGLHGMLDGDTWSTADILGPGGTFRVVRALANDDSVEFGLTQLFFESNEPPIGERSFNELKTQFPPGVYEAVGATPDNGSLTATKSLTADLPCPPRVFAPQVDDDELVLKWRLKPGVYDPDTQICDSRRNVDVATIEAIVDLQRPGSSEKRTYDVLLAPDSREIAVPMEFFRGSDGLAAKAEILIIDRSGNRTAVEREFVKPSFNPRRN